jgi:peptidyl-prolyl cis-trans isomerase A (cyclophilin A)
MPFFSRACLVALVAVSAMTLATSPVQAASPETFQVKFETTAGDFVIEVTRKWAPLGADRFHELVLAGFYNDCGFFRVIPNFMVQFGINGDPKVQAKWKALKIKDDPVTQSNARGTITFATAGPGTRTSQLFINYKDNKLLDGQGFAPFGKVVEGMAAVDKINPEYREQPGQGQIQSSGNVYLKKQFPNLSFIKKATIVKPKK